MLAFLAVSDPLPLSVTLITLNEEANLPRTLNALRWVQDTVVIDSGSQDRTCDIAREYGARVYTRAWSGYGPQKNYAQSQARFDWVLNLDADEVVTGELEKEIRALFTAPMRPEDGYAIPRKTFFLGRWIQHGGWYPNYVTRLAHRTHASWSEPELHESLRVPGTVHRLKSPVVHYTFQDLMDQAETNLRYAQAGAQNLKKNGQKFSLLKLLLKPIGKFIECYWIKRGFLDGLPGFLISINAAYSIFLKYALLAKFPDTVEKTHPS